MLSQHEYIERGRNFQATVVEQLPVDHIDNFVSPPFFLLSLLLFLFPLFPPFLLSFFRKSMKMLCSKMGTLGCDSFHSEALMHDKVSVRGSQTG